MLKRVFFIVAIALSATLVRAGTITVSAAISLKDALTDIGAQYEKQGGDHVEFQFGASGQLAAQIRQGAPVDVFISAAQKQVTDLAKDGLLNQSSIFVVAGNKLVLIVPASATQALPKDFADLTDARFKKIAIGDPATVPAGDYAMQVLDALKVSTALKDRLIQGTNVRQVLNYVERGEVDAGIVYMTDSLESGDKVKLAAVADETMHKPIEYPAAIVTKSKSRDSAAKFLDFLKADYSKRKLAERGFTTQAR